MIELFLGLMILGGMGCVFAVLAYLADKFAESD